MKPKTVYLMLCFAGAFLPYWQFVPWAAQHGLDLPLFVRELFASRIGAFFGMDVVVSAVVLLVFRAHRGCAGWDSTAMGRDRRRAYSGSQLGLLLFLYLRELALERKPIVT